MLQQGAPLFGFCSMSGFGVDWDGVIGTLAQRSIASSTSWPPPSAGPVSMRMVGGLKPPALSSFGPQVFQFTKPPLIAFTPG